MQKQSKTRNLFTISHLRPVFSCLQDSRVPSHITVSWEGKHRHSKHPPLPPSSPSFMFWAWCHRVWNAPWVSCGPLLMPCAPPAHSLVGWCEEQEGPWLHKYFSAIVKHHRFHHESKILLHHSFYEENYPSQNQHRYAELMAPTSIRIAWFYLYITFQSVTLAKFAS